MKKILSGLVIVLCILAMMTNCAKNKKSDIASGTCSDGIKNQNETNVDCGGVCSVCQSCSDGIKNQGETGIDCGGPCGLCPITYAKNGFYGPNILGDTLKYLMAGPFPPNATNKPYSLACKLSSGTSIKIRMTCLSTNVGVSPRPWGYDVSSLGTWKIISNDNVMEFYNDSEINPDLKLIFGGDGTASVDIFENGADNPTRTKQISWKQQ